MGHTPPPKQEPEHSSPFDGPRCACCGAPLWAVFHGMSESMKELYKEADKDDAYLDGPLE